MGEWVNNRMDEWVNNRMGEWVNNRMGEWGNPFSVKPATRAFLCTANAARSAAERLGSAVGATYSEDILERLFSRFCVGK